MNDFETELAQDAQRKAPQDKLEFVRDKVRHMRDLDLHILEAEETVSRLKNERKEMEMMTLPDLFMQLGINHLGLDAEGNMPACEAKIRDYYHANIKADWPLPQRQQAFDWLKDHKLDDIVKTTITIELGRGSAKILQKLQTALNKLKVPFEIHQAVPWKSLTSVVKERYVKGKPLGDSELRTLGATVGKIVKLTPVKGD